MDIKNMLRSAIESLRLRRTTVVFIKTRLGGLHINDLDKLIVLDDRLIIVRVTQLEFSDIEDIK